MGAVKNAIQRDELDPTIMDLDPEKSLEGQRPQAIDDSSNDQPESSGPMASVVNSVMDACQVCCLPESESKEEEEKTDESNLDPRQTLMAMLNKRTAPPTDTEPQTNTEVEKDTPKTEVEKLSEESDPDPRAALMSMLSKRAPPTTDEPTNVDQIIPSHMQSVEKSKNEAKEEEEEDVKDPRAALMSMLNKRAPPQEEEVKDESVEKKTTEETTPDPRAALMTMLNKRAPPPADDIESKTETEEQKVEDANPDPRAALMSMLNKRSPPAEQDKPADSKTVKPEKEATEVKPDPRAALMSMINKRAPPEPVKEESKGEHTADAPAKTAEKASTEADVSPSIQNDPRFAKYFKMLKMVRCLMILSDFVVYDIHCSPMNLFLIFGRDYPWELSRMRCKEMNKIQLSWIWIQRSLLKVSALQRSLMTMMDHH